MPDEPYQGQWMYSCRSALYDWGNVRAIVVSGDSWNPCGHALLQVGADTFHIGGWRRRPYHLTYPGYTRCLRENRKRELRRDRISIPDPAGAQRKLEELTSRPWQWVILPHNCATFVEAVVQAGGARRVGLYLNCPAVETFE